MASSPLLMRGDFTPSLDEEELEAGGGEQEQEERPPEAGLPFSGYFTPGEFVSVPGLPGPLLASPSSMSEGQQRIIPRFLNPISFLRDDDDHRFRETSSTASEAPQNGHAQYVFGHSGLLSSSSLPPAEEVKKKRKKSKKLKFGEEIGGGQDGNEQNLMKKKKTKKKKKKEKKEIQERGKEEGQISELPSLGKNGGLAQAQETQKRKKKKKSVEPSPQSPIISQLPGPSSGPPSRKRSKVHHKSALPNSTPGAPPVTLNDIYNYFCGYHCQCRDKPFGDHCSPALLGPCVPPSPSSVFYPSALGIRDQNPETPKPMIEQPRKRRKLTLTSPDDAPPDPLNNPHILNPEAPARCAKKKKTPEKPSKSLPLATEKRLPLATEKRPHRSKRLVKQKNPKPPLSAISKRKKKQTVPKEEPLDPQPPIAFNELQGEDCLTLPLHSSRTGADSQKESSPLSSLLLARLSDSQFYSSSLDLSSSSRLQDVQHMPSSSPSSSRPPSSETAKFSLNSNKANVHDAYPLDDLDSALSSMRDEPAPPSPLPMQLSSSILVSPPPPPPPFAVKPARPVLSPHHLHYVVNHRGQRYYGVTELRPHKPLFRCAWSKCGGYFSAASGLQEHLCVNHARKASVRQCLIRGCSLKGELFATQEEFESHVTVHITKTIHTADAFSCSFCPQVFLNKFDFEVHLESHSEERRTLNEPIPLSSTSCTDLSQTASLPSPQVQHLPPPPPLPIPPSVPSSRVVKRSSPISVRPNLARDSLKNIPPSTSPRRGSEGCSSASLNHSLDQPLSPSRTKRKGKRISFEIVQIDEFEFFAADSLPSLPIWNKDLPLENDSDVSMPSPHAEPASPSPSPLRTHPSRLFVTRKPASRKPASRSSSISLALTTVQRGTLSRPSISSRVSRSLTKNIAPRRLQGSPSTHSSLSLPLPSTSSTALPHRRVRPIRLPVYPPAKGRCSLCQLPTSHSLKCPRCGRHFHKRCYRRRYPSHDYLQSGFRCAPCSSRRT